VENGKQINGQKPAILCLIDFSEASRQALTWAASEANKQQAQVIVLYPYRLKQMQGKDNLLKIREGINTEAIFNFEKIAKDTLIEAKVPFEFKPEIGFMNDRVYAHSHRKEFSLLVISKSMAMENKENMMELIDLIKFPLVIVPQSKP
jgi:Universal stress protein family